MKQTLQVHLTPAEIEPFNDQPVLVGNELVQKLKTAGVPVGSVIWPFKVGSGELTMHVNENGIVAVWVGEAPEAKATEEDGYDLV